MQPKRAECLVEHEREAAAHVTCSGMRRERVVAQIAALERAAHDLAQIEDSDERVVVPAKHEKADMREIQRVDPRRSSVARNERTVALGAQRRLHPPAMQIAA